MPAPLHSALPQRIAVVASASGNGKSTLGRALAARLDAPYVELDALVHGPGWGEASDEDLRAALAPTLSLERWVVDGGYRAKIGDLVLEQANLVVWLDLPIHVWLPRLLRRSARRLIGREEMWNGNRETLRGVIGERDALVPYALRSHRDRRRRYPAELAAFPVERLRTRADVDRFVERFGQPGSASGSAVSPPGGGGDR